MSGLREELPSEFPRLSCAEAGGAGKLPERARAVVRAVVKGAIALQEIRGRQGHPKLKELVLEASRALARLDADRLEELALSCQALNRDLAERDRAHGNRADRAALALEAQEAVGDMAVFSRVLEATRSNLNVMNRLRELRGGRLEYGEGRFESCPGSAEPGDLKAQQWRRTESRHGDN